jgi:hypothetical protein
MKRKSNPFEFFNRKIVSVAVSFIWFGISAVTISAQSYSGEAAAVKSTTTAPLAPVLTTAVNSTGPLPSTGGSVTLSSLSANVPGVITIADSTASTSGGVPGGNVNTSQSSASVNSVSVAVSGVVPTLTVTADAVSSNVQASCPNQQITRNSSITNLRIGGNVVSISGGANQTVVTTVGTVTLTVVINEQFFSPGSMTVNALHVAVADSLTGVTNDVIVASSHADITCVETPAANRYSGRGTGVRLQLNTTVPASSTSTIVTDTGFLPTSGGNIATSTANVNLVGLLTTGVVSSSTSGGLPGGDAETSQSVATVNNLGATLAGGVGITATLIKANTQCQCSLANVASCSGDSLLTNLAVTTPLGPLALTVDGSVNQTVPLPLGLGTLIINEQTSANSGDLTINALHVILTPIGLARTDLVVAHAHSDIKCGSASTAANSSISGRVTTSSGRGIGNVFMTLSNDSIRRTVYTNAFGYYRFENVPAGQAYELTPMSKRYSFDSRTVMLNDELNGADFAPNGNEP